MQSRIATLHDILQKSDFLNTLFYQEIEFISNKEK